MDKSSAKYAVCTDLVNRAESLNKKSNRTKKEKADPPMGKIELEIDDDYVEMDTKYIRISVRPCSEENQNEIIYQNFISKSKNGSKPEGSNFKPPQGNLDVKNIGKIFKNATKGRVQPYPNFCRPDRDSILKTNKLILIFGYNEVTFDFQNFHNPIDYNYNTERWFHCFLGKTFERKVFFSKTEIETDHGYLGENINTKNSM